ncbi:methylenetetrahydrofolate reductase [Pseudonocardia sulfidoxydans NBRC 16205]|uniref:Methylenetetrahydrofolate reductase n=1 Tax=Pseudonocardia sulfidoxydans NBRC 16205 TaxID=1223511 RepID=A0A511DLR7_9PSEU|nr:methylenetetrahydrofolate reductase [Pseudonocardia sulfidoxydans]GEL25203.1 methylenetetrahydrofolate reductase [Pseudonocardia sulfidoxydans NBRC 16205]
MTSTGTPDTRTALRGALQTLGYEVMPFARTHDAVREHVPTSIRLTVTASPQKGIDATVELALALAADGYSVAPHLSARMISGPAQLDDILARLTANGVRRLFVVGGDGEASGTFTEALGLLRAIRGSGHDFADIGIGGYPEGHALIPPERLSSALVEKAALADHITTQICFAPATLLAYSRSLVEQGVTLPVVVGVPGAVSRQKLLRITASIGVGDSARFLRKQSSLFWRFFVPGGYNPTSLVRGLRSELGGSSTVSGFHVFTFNDVESTERWRRRMLDRLDAVS